jgi:hypothetical protein
LRSILILSVPPTSRLYQQPVYFFWRHFVCISLHWCACCVNCQSCPWWNVEESTKIRVRLLEAWPAWDFELPHQMWHCTPGWTLVSSLFLTRTSVSVYINRPDGFCDAPGLQFNVYCELFARG